MFETAFESPPDQRLGGDLTVRLDYGTFSKLYFGLSGQAAYVFGAKKADGAGDLIPLGFTFWDKNSLMSNVELRAGFDGYFGWRAGLAASLGFL